MSLMYLGGLGGSGSGAGGAGGLKLAVIGSSLTQHNTTVNFGSNRIGNSARGWINWFNAFMGQPFSHPNWIDSGDANGRNFSGANFGVSGQASTVIAGRISDVIARRPDIVVLQSGTNNVSSDAIVYADNTSMIDRLIAAGIAVLYFPITPRRTTNVGADTTAWAAGSEARKNAMQLNERMKQYCLTKKGAIYVDVNKYLVDPDTNDGDPFSNVLDDSVDSVHFSNHGAFLIGLAIYEQVKQLFPQNTPLRISNPEDLYDATHNVFGNHWVNPTMSITSTTNHSTAGSVGTGVTAATGSGDTSVARNVRVERSSGASTGVARMIDRTQGLGKWQELEVTAAGEAGETLFLIRSNSADITHTLAAGTWVQAGFDAQMDAFGSNARFSGFRNLDANLDLRGTGGSLGVARGMEQFGAYDLPNMAWSGTIITQPFQIPTGCDRFRYRAEVIVDDNTTGGTGKVRVGSMFIRQVPDPRIEWRY
jgi:lysophospholipase L1-like esterase